MIQLIGMFASCLPSFADLYFDPAVCYRRKMAMTMKWMSPEEAGRKAST
jgi:hypothetical protein